METLPTARPLDVPVDVRLSPRECFALATLLEDERAFDGLTDAFRQHGAPTDDAAEAAAEALAHTLARAPWRDGRPPVPHAPTGADGAR